MLTSIVLIVVGFLVTVFIFGLVSDFVSLKERVFDLEREKILREQLSRELEYFEKTLKNMKEVNAQVFELITKQLGKEFKKTRVIETDRFGNETIVSKFELVDLQKAKKTK